MTTTDMRAWRVGRLGEPADVLHPQTVAAPAAGPGEVEVRITAVALNFPDVLLCRGEYQVRPELPFIPGIEFVGTVAATGAGVDGVAVGSRVVGSKIGVLAERAVLPAADVWPAPGALSDAEAAGLTIAYQTAWFGLHRRAALRAGEWVLVHAAAGGVGLAAVQLAAAAGARVIAVVGDEAKADAARSSGADVVLIRGVDDLVSVAKAATAGRGVDVVFDPVGGEAFESSTRCIAFEGRIVVVGFAGGTIPSVPAGHVLVKNYTVLGLHWGLYPARRPDLVEEARAEITRLVAEGRITPVVDRVVPFDRAPEALTALAAGRNIGRIVVEVG